jgi:hypothetical protein
LRLEVHRQERQVAGDVDPAQAGVELHAVHDRERGAGQHMLAAQIAVTIPREPERRTPAELGRVNLHEGIGEGAHHVQAPALRMSRCRQLRQVLLPGLADALVAPAPRGGRGAMEIREQPGDPLEHLASEAIGLDQAPQRVPLVEGAHLDGVLHRSGCALTGEAKALPADEDRAHAEIDPGGEVLVHADLLATGGMPACQRAVVEKAQCERLLDLVGAHAGHKHPRGMRLMHHHPWMSPIGGRGAHRREQLRVAERLSAAELPAASIEVSGCWPGHLALHDREVEKPLQKASCG